VFVCSIVVEVCFEVTGVGGNVLVPIGVLVGVRVGRVGAAFFGVLFFMAAFFKGVDVVVEAGLFLFTSISSSLSSSLLSLHEMVYDTVQNNQLPCKLRKHSTNTHSLSSFERHTL
jgi:hypothetical protein